MIARRGARAALLAAILAGAVAAAPPALPAIDQKPTAAAAAAPIAWRLDNLSRIGGHPVTVVGHPRVVNAAEGASVEFDGRNDGLVVNANPLAGLTRFTLEVLFNPAADGAPEQRFLHIEETGAANRALIELRLDPPGRWSLDTYLRHGENGLTLLDRSIAHDAGRWHAAALTFDGRTMSHFVNGQREGGGEVAFKPLGAGRTSLGVRQNLVSHFKGRIALVRVTPEVLAPAAMLRAPSGTDQQEIPLWPEGVPGVKPNGGAERIENGRVYNVQAPSLVRYAPAGAANGTAVIVCPGGSYARLAIANEAAGVAARLTPLGVTVFVLKYRLAEFGQPAPLQDVLRAVRIVRSQATAFGIRTDRIGVFGASAGGHVAASAAVFFDAPEGTPGRTPLDAIEARPTFVALLYPVISMRDPHAHAESRRNLLGPSPAEALLSRWSLEEHARPDAPPVFLVHTLEDRSVPAEHSLMFTSALRRAGVPTELHVYERGAHGFGVATDLGPASGWIDRCLEWMREHGWL